MTPATPSRLVRRHGNWALEVTRLVPVDGKVLEPRAQRLEGTDAILRHLRHQSEQTALATGAAQLMRTMRGDGDRAFIVLDGEWVPSGDAGVLQADIDLRGQLADLRSELLLLRASHQRLRARVAALEARLENVGPASRPPGSAPPRSDSKVRALPEPARPEVAALRQASAAAPAVADQTRQSAGMAPELPPPVNPFREAAAALAPAGRPPDNPVKLPTPEAVMGAINELFGGDSGFTLGSAPLPDSSLELAALYAGRFVDDDGTDLGALLAELRLVAHIGGKLMGLPTTVIDEQARTGLLNDQVLAAMSEVVNTLSTTVNAVAGNPHVRGTPIEPFSVEKLDWVGNARERVTLVKTRIGTLWLVGR